MTWHIDIASVSRAERRLHSDVADLALKSGSLEHENARLRADMKDAQQAIDTLRAAHAVAATELLQAEQVIQRIVSDALKVPSWPLSRWVRFGPMASALSKYFTGATR